MQIKWRFDKTDSKNGKNQEMWYKSKISMKYNESTKDTMLPQVRSEKVFVSALISLTIGAVIFSALGHKPLSAGAFSLSKYYRLEPIERVISSDIVQPDSRWDRIRISYNGTKAGDIDKVPSPRTLIHYDDVNYHFIICNGLIGEDGQIQPTRKWRRQMSITPARNGSHTERTIRICLLDNTKTLHPTELQNARMKALVEALSRKFNIRLESIFYPDNWH